MAAVTKRNLAVLVVVAIIIGFIPAAVFADPEETIEEISSVKDTALVEYGTSEEDALKAVEEGTLYEGIVGEEESVFLDVDNWEAVEYNLYEPGEFAYTFEGEAEAPAGYEFAEDVDTAVEAKVTVEIEAEEGETIKGYIEDLADMGPRTAGSDTEYEAVEYLAEKYEELGLDYEVEIQEFTVADYNGPENLPLGNLEIKDGEDFYGEVRAFVGDRFWTYDEHHGTEWQTMSYEEGAMEEIEGTLIDAGEATEEGDFPAEVEGNVALVELDQEMADEQLSAAVKAGAEAVIFSTGRQAFMPELEEEVDVPVLGASSIHGDWLQEMLEEREAEVELESYIDEDLVSHNVVAIREAEDDDAPIFHITGHLDSVPGSPGASDNASGTSTVLKLAEALEDKDIDAELRFVHFGAEEVGLTGAFHYVGQLSEEEKMRSFNFNLDMVCTSDPDINLLSICPADGEPNLVTDMVKQADEELGYDITVLYEVAASDHFAFHQQGIPAAVAAYQGEQAFVLDPNYHTPIDTVEDNVSAGRIQKAFDIHKEAILTADEVAEVPEMAQKVQMMIDSPVYEVNGMEKEMDLAPFIEDGRAFVPVRFLAEALAAEADWTTDPETGLTKEVTLERRDIEISISIGKDEFETYNRWEEETETIELDVPASIKDGRTVLPFRAIGEAFGLEVGYSTDLETGLVDQVWWFTE